MPPLGLRPRRSRRSAAEEEPKEGDEPWDGQAGSPNSVMTTAHHWEASSSSHDRGAAPTRVSPEPDEPTIRGLASRALRRRSAPPSAAATAAPEEDYVRRGRISEPGGNLSRLRCTTSCVPLYLYFYLSLKPSIF